MKIDRRVFLASLAGAAAITGSNEAVYSYGPADWQRIRGGLEFSRVGVYANQGNVDTLAVIRADPERNRFRLFYDRGNRRTAEEWQKYAGADAVFNAGFYRYAKREPFGFTTEPTALIISDGSMSGPAKNRRVRGMFVSEPKSGRNPYARVIDMDHECGYDRYGWNTGLQSWPMLVHSNGHFGAPSSRGDSRTAICEDGSGRILAVTTEDNNLTLYHFARVLRESGLDIKKALNLDGGHAAQMNINSGGFEYATYGKEESSFGIPFINTFIENVKIPIPGVIGIFPRK